MAKGKSEKKKVGEITEAMQKHLNFDTASFLSGLYSAIGTKRLFLRYREFVEDEEGGIVNIEQIFDSLDKLAPHQDEVISMLELMNTLSKRGVQEPIRSHHLLRYPEKIVKLSKNAQIVYDFFKEVNKRKCKTYDKVVPIYNLDNVLALARNPEQTLEVLDGFIERGITCFATTQFKDGDPNSMDCGFIDNTKFIGLIHKDKEAYFRGLDTLLEAGYGTAQLKEDRMAKDTMWGNLYNKHYKEVIHLGEDVDLQKLVKGLVTKDLISDSDLGFILRHIKNLDLVAPYYEEFLEFAEKYNTMVENVLKEKKKRKEYVPEHYLNEAENCVYYGTLNNLSRGEGAGLIGALLNQKAVLKDMANWFNEYKKWYLGGATKQMLKFGAKYAR